MKRTTKITAFLLTLVMLLGMIPFSALAADEATLTEAAAEESVLDQLAAKATGSLYEGISIPDGATKLDDKKAAGAPNSEKSSYVSTGDPDGSKALTDTTDDITSTEDAGTKTDITFTYGGAYTLTRGDDNNRYVVASINLMYGEALNYNFIRIRAYKRDIATTYDQDGNVVGEPKVTAITSGSAGTAFKSDISIFTVSNGDISLGNGGIADFNSNLYTNFGLIVDTVDNVLYIYLNGVHVETIENFFAKLSVDPVTVENEDGTKTVTTYEWQNLNFSAMFGTNNPVAGKFLQSGSIKVYKTGDAAKVFDSEGNFIYANKTPANGVFKIDGEYYFFKDGIAQDGKTVTCEGYTLELEESTGRIVNCYKTTKSDFIKKTVAELKSAGATMYVQDHILSNYSNMQYVATDGTTTITAYRYKTDDAGEFVLDDDGNKIVETYKVDSTRAFYFVSGSHATIGPKTYEPNILEGYYSSKANLENGKLTPFPTYNGKAASDITYNFANPSFTDDVEEYVIRFDAKFGEGVNTFTSKGKAASAMALFRLRCKSTAGKNLDPGIKLQRVGDHTELYLGTTPLNIVCDTNEFHNYQFAFKQDGTTLTLSAYVDGELRSKDVTVSTDASYLDFFGVYIAADTAFSEDLITFGKTDVYAGTNLDATDYSGISSTINGLAYYNNGDLKAIGSTADVEKIAGIKYAGIEGYGAALGDTTYLDFYMNLGALASEAGARARITVGDEVSEVSLSNLATKNDLYKLTVKLSSIQLSERVWIEILDGEGKKVNIYRGNKIADAVSYSFREYASYILDDSALYSEETVNLVKATLLFGAFAERVFTNEVGLATARDLSNFERLAVQYGTIGTFYTDVSVKSKIFQKTLNDHTADVDLTVTASDATKVGAVKLVLNSAIKIRIALTATEAPESIEGGVLYTEEKDGVTKYYVDIDGLKPSDLNTVKTVTVDGTEIKITALAVANAVVNPVGDASYSKAMQDLMKAMYLYYYYADAYVKSIA